MSFRVLPSESVSALAVLGRCLGWQVDWLEDDTIISAAAGSPTSSTQRHVNRFVRELWRDTDDELFGLGTHPVPRGSFRLLFYGLVGTHNLGEAIGRFADLVSAVPALPSLAVEKDPSHVRIALDLRLGPESDPVLDDQTGLAMVSCIALAVLHRLMAWCVDAELPLQSVELPYPASHRETHAFVFDAPLVFDAERVALVIDPVLLRLPMMRTPEEFDELIRNAPENLLSRRRGSARLSARVRRIVERSIPVSGSGQRLAARDVAAQLNVGATTLRRRLAAEHTSYPALRDDVLRRSALTALATTDEASASIASRLGFSEQSSFTRAFRRWTGESPGAYRRAARAAELASRPAAALETGQ